MPSKKIALTDAPRALAAYGATPTYQQLWHAAISGQIPAEKVGKRWMIREDDLKATAHALTNA